MNRLAIKLFSVICGTAFDTRMIIGIYIIGSTIYTVISNIFYYLELHLLVSVFSALITSLIESTYFRFPHWHLSKSSGDSPSWSL